jgi:hypothetical protein
MKHTFYLISVLALFVFNLDAGWSVEKSKGKMLQIGFYDGGSFGLPLIHSDGRKVDLILGLYHGEMEVDEHGFPIILPSFSIEHGLLYLGGDNFSEGKPFKPSHPLFEELEEFVINLEKDQRERNQGLDTSDLTLIINAFNRMKSNKTVQATPNTANLSL